MLDSNTSVVGIGAAHFYNISKSVDSPIYTLENVENLINSRLNRCDDQFNTGTASPKYWLSNLILVQAVMKHFNFTTITAARAFDNPDIPAFGNTAALITSDLFHSKEKIAKNIFSTAK